MSAALAHPTPTAADGDQFRWTRMGDLPRKGWELVHVSDHGDPTHTCEACGYPAVRYAHLVIVEHDGDLVELAVGGVCAGHLTGNYAAGARAERDLMNRSGRLARLLDSGRWRRTAAGNLRISYRRARIIVYPSQFGPGWRVQVGTRPGRRDHPSREAAIVAAFNFLDPPRAYAGQH